MKKLILLSLPIFLFACSKNEKTEQVIVETTLKESYEIPGSGDDNFWVWRLYTNAPELYNEIKAFNGKKNFYVSEFLGNLTLLGGTNKELTIDGDSIPYMVLEIPDERDTLREKTASFRVLVRDDSITKRQVSITINYTKYQSKKVKVSGRKYLLNGTSESALMSEEEILHLLDSSYVVLRKKLGSRSYL